MNDKKGTKILFLIACIVINIVGKYIGTQIVSPFWLDSIGKGLAAYFLGPLWGAAAGVLVDLSYAIYIDEMVVALYGFTAIVIAYTIGICAKRGYIGQLRMMLPVSMLLALTSTVISLPINCLLARARRPYS